MNQEQLEIAIELANEVREANTDKASELCESIITEINVNQYNDIDTSVMVLVVVSKGRDKYSGGYAADLRTTYGYTELDLHRFKMVANEVCDKSMDDLRQ